MKFKGWVKVVLREECEVEGDSYTEALLLTKEESKKTKEFYDQNDNVVGIEYGVTPLSKEEQNDQGC